MTTLFARVTRPAPPDRDAAPRRPTLPGTVPGLGLPTLLRTAVPAGPVRVVGLELPALIGIYPQEHKVPQRLRIGLELESAGPGAPDVETATALAAGIVQDGHVGLLETLAERIAAALLAHPAVTRATVRLEKPDAFAAAAAVGIEITRMRDRARA